MRKEGGGVYSASLRYRTSSLLFPEGTDGEGGGGVAGFRGPNSENDTPKHHDI